MPGWRSGGADSRVRLFGVALAVSLLLQPAEAGRAWAAAPQPAISLTPNCGPVAGPAALAQTYAIDVIGKDFNPNLDLLTIVFNPGPSAQSFRAYQDGKGNLDTVIHPTRVQAGTYQVSVFFADIPQATAQFTVPCPPTPPPTPTPTPTPLVTPSAPPSRPGSPTLTLTPSVGPPGTVVVASGAGFPANGKVQLAWSQGILNPLLATAPTDLNGSFTEQVLIFPHDVLGSRTLTATSIDVPSAPALASAPFLVVPGQVQPRGFSFRR